MFFAYSYRDTQINAMNRQNKWLPDYMDCMAGSPARGRRSHRDAEASDAADSVNARSAGLAVSVHPASGSAPASGAANRAPAVGIERRAVARARARTSVTGERVFREGAEDGRRGRLRSRCRRHHNDSVKTASDIMRDRGLTESMRSISLSINTAVTRPTILARVIEPSNNNKS